MLSKEEFIEEEFRKELNKHYKDGLGLDIISRNRRNAKFDMLKKFFKLGYKLCERIHDEAWRKQRRMRDE